MTKKKFKCFLDRIKNRAFFYNNEYPNDNRLSKALDYMQQFTDKKMRQKDFIANKEIICAAEYYSGEIYHQAPEMQRGFMEIQRVHTKKQLKGMLLAYLVAVCCSELAILASYGEKFKTIISTRECFTERALLLKLDELEGIKK